MVFRTFKCITFTVHFISNRRPLLTPQEALVCGTEAGDPALRVSGPKLSPFPKRGNGLWSSELFSPRTVVSAHRVRVEPCTGPLTAPGATLVKPRPDLCCPGSILLFVWGENGGPGTHSTTWRRSQEYQLQPRS